MPVLDMTLKNMALKSIALTIAARAILALPPLSVGGTSCHSLHLSVLG